MTPHGLLGSAIRFAAGVLPDRLLARLMPPALSWNPDEMGIARAPRTAVRLLVGPVNSAGQGNAWARAAERLEGVGAVDLMVTDASTARFSFPADVYVPATGYTFARQWRRAQREAIRSGFTHLLLESGRYAYGSVPFRTPRDVAQDLQQAGVKVALLWHGTDIRLPGEHAARVEDSPFGERGDYPAGRAEIHERNARVNREFVARTDFPVFVSTPGQLDVERSQWLPVVVDPDRWASPTPVLERDVPVVVYAPSNSPMKGADSIDTDLTALAAEGLIEYRRPGHVPSAEMPRLYGDADIVLDQFRLGDYGVAACEAMAAGRVVIGHVSDEVRRIVAQQTGRELPIVESRFADVGTTIRAVLADRAQYRGRAAAGAEYVRAVHDGARAAEVLAPFLGVATR